MCHSEESAIGYSRWSPFYFMVVYIVNDGRIRIWIVQGSHIQVLEGNFPNRRKQNGLFRKSLQIFKRLGLFSMAKKARLTHIDTLKLASVTLAQQEKVPFSYCEHSTVGLYTKSLLFI